LSKRYRNIWVLLAIGVLAIPGAALARNDHSKGHNNHKVGYVFTGTFNADGSVAVKHGNRHVRKAGFVGQDVSFDFSAARIVVNDTNGDSVRDINDVTAGDNVLVKARLGRTDPGSQPFEAKKLVDRTHPPVADESGP
jgi:hypothetical protein